MISDIHIGTHPDKVEEYFEEDFSADSPAARYYSQDGKISGHWFGKAAAMLGLDGPVRKEAFSQLSRNIDPSTGKLLTQRHREDARVSYDPTICAPKSVSVMALVMGDERIIEAHELAVTETLALMETLTATRLRKAGAEGDRSTGNFVGGRFLHFLSRENDPLLHTHPVIFNATYDEAEQRWKAIQPVEFFKQKSLLIEFYRSSLVAKLHRLGYPTESTPHGFEIAGVDREVVEIFSKRQKQIDEIANAIGSNSPALRGDIAHKHRKAKDANVTIESLRADWLSQLSTEQVAALQAIKAAATAPVTVEPVSAEQALDLAAEHLYERRSVVRDHELFTEALAAARGHTDLPALQAALHSGSFLIDNREVTTPAALEAEQRMIGFVNAGVNACEPLAPGFAAADTKISGETVAVVDALLSCPDRVVALRGPAGAGKSTSLNAVKRGLHAHGHKVVVCAPQAGQVDRLVAEGFVGAMTLERLLTDRDRQKELLGEVILLDEAGLVSVRQLNQLFDLAQERGCRVLLSGDSRQHKGVEAGDALRILEMHSNLSSAALSTIWRQKHEDYKAAISALKDGDTSKGFNALNMLGWVLQLSDNERYHRIGTDYLDAREHGKSALVVCATWRECAAATERVRFYLQAKKLLSTDESQAQTLQPLSQFTRAQLAQAHRFKPGMFVVFNRKSQLFKRDEVLEVLGSEDGFVKVRNPKGETLLFKAKKEAKHVSVFEPKSITVAPGEQLLIRRNGLSANPSPKKLTNGELVTVKAISPSGTITLRDGRILPSGFRHYTHGYAVTSQNSQGKTVDRVLVAINAQSALAAATRETLYVSASRGRERCTLYTDDKGLLARAFHRSGERKAALEFVQQQQTKQPSVPTTNEREPSTTTGLRPTAGVSQQQPIPATRMPPPPPGLPLPHLCHGPGSGTGFAFRPQPRHPARGNRAPGIPEQQPVCGLPGIGSQLPEAQLHSQDHDGPQAALAL